MRNLGLIGGLGPRATVHYYRELAKDQAGKMLLFTGYYGFRAYRLR